MQAKKLTQQIKTITKKRCCSSRESFIKDDTFDKGADGTNVKYVAKSISGEKDKVVINGCIDALNGTVEVSQKDGVINTDFNDITLNASVENTRIYKGNAAFTSIETEQNTDLCLIT